jgi:hypothetical protein
MAPRLAVKFLVQLLSGIQHLCYVYSHTPERSGAPRRHIRRKAQRGKRFFVWIRPNPLKRPDSAKGIQGNPSLFPWISLDLFAFICIYLA